MENKLFYVYSKRLKYFLNAMGFRWEESDINPKTSYRYWAFQKSDKLNDAIKDFELLKNKYN